MTHTSNGRRHRTLAFAAIVLASLAACNSDDGDPTTTTPPATTSLTVTGAAATGAALAGRPVDAKCATGTGTTTTAADGTFTVTLDSASLPCALRVTAADGSTLHSLATGSGAGTAKANLTPVSELVVARLSAGAAAAYFAAFDATAAAALTSTQADAAVAAVVDTLKSAGVDLSAIGNVLTGTLVAANGSAAGNAFDQALDALKAKLTSSGITLAALAALADTVARTAPQAAATTLSGTPSLPAEMLLRPAAANCAAFRSGRYRAIDVLPSANGQVSTGIITLDAPNLTNDEGSGAKSLDWTSNGPCRYSEPTGEEIVISQAGVIVARGRDNATSPYRLSLVFPEQTHSLSELAGVWNTLQMKTHGTAPTTANSTTHTVDDAGVVTAGIFCEDLRTCAAVPTTLRYSVNAAGGFDFRNTAETWTDRVFMYRSGGGEPMLVKVALNGSVQLATHKRVSTQPTVGAVNAGWNVTLDSQGRPTVAIDDYSNTIVSNDTAAGTFGRNAVFNFTTGATVPQTVTLNSPRDGYNSRSAGTGVVASDGSLRNFPEWIGLSLRGMGISGSGYTVNKQFFLSVTKP